MKQTAYQEHAPISYAYKIVSIDPKYNSNIKLYRGEDAAQHFLKEVTRECEDIFQTYIKVPKEMVKDEKSEKIFQEATMCCICNEALKPLTLHCHNNNEDVENCDMCIQNRFKAPVLHCHNNGIKPTTCKICQENRKLAVRDHCHITGVNIFSYIFFVLETVFNILIFYSSHSIFYSIFLGFSGSSSQ